MRELTFSSDEFDNLMSKELNHGLSSVKVSLALWAADADPRSPTPYDTSSDGHE